MWQNFSKLNLARRYLWGALIAALIPLILIAVIYDRYSASLLNTLVTNRLNSDVEAVAARMSNYLTSHRNRLKNIADLRDVTLFFQNSHQTLSPQLADLMFLEVGSPDIYAIEFSNSADEIIFTVPTLRSREPPENFTTLPFVEIGGTEIIGPVLPDNGRPGWILIRQPVLREQQLLGYVAIRARLSSLTELASDLAQPGVHIPQLTIFDRIQLSVVGTEMEAGKRLARSSQILPGWRLTLIEGGSDLNEPRRRIRYVLLFVATLSALGLVFLFLRMSQRLSGYLLPLNTGAQAISNGDFTITVSEDGPGELGTLARSYNKMREQLEELIASRVDMERRATLGNMAAGIAHEIRNPLTTVSATLHGLSGGEEDPERKEMYDLVSSEITRVDQTISEFVNFAKPRKPEQEVAYIRDALKSVKTLISATARERSISVSLSGDSRLKAYVDPAQLRQIILNLSLNAMDAMPDGGQLRFRTYEDSGKAKVVVADNGIGMDDVVKEKLLRPFFTTRSGGTGLGLSITKQLVDANGGTMVFDSVAGEGTTVSLRFPLPVQKAKI
ncbi:MAG: ATP-binding protein [Paracoccaceae bacterium]